MKNDFFPSFEGMQLLGVIELIKCLAREKTFEGNWQVHVIFVAERLLDVSKISWRKTWRWKAFLKCKFCLKLRIESQNAKMSSSLMLPKNFMFPLSTRTLTDASSILIFIKYFHEITDSKMIEFIVQRSTCHNFLKIAYFVNITSVDQFSNWNWKSMKKSRNAKEFNANSR